MGLQSMWDYPRWMQDVIITSFLHEKDVTTSFWRNNDVIITLCARWICVIIDRYNMQGCKHVMMMYAWLTSKQFIHVNVLN